MSSIDPTSNVSSNSVTNDPLSTSEAAVSSDSSTSVLSSNSSNYSSGAKRAGKVLGGLTYDQQIQLQYSKQQIFEKQYNDEEIADFQQEIITINNSDSQNSQGP